MPLLLLLRRRRRRSIAQTESAESARVAEGARAEGAIVADGLGDVAGLQDAFSLSQLELVGLVLVELDVDLSGVTIIFAPPPANIRYTVYMQSLGPPALPGLPMTSYATG